MSRWLSCVGCSVGGFIAFVLFTRLVAGLHGFAPLEGLDYVEPWWLAVFVLPLGLFCLFVGSRRTGALLVALLLVLLGAEDDWRWHGRTEIPRETPSFSVLALNVRYYRAGRAEVVQGIKSLDPDIVLLSENRVDASGVNDLKAAFAPYDLVAGRSDETGIASRLPILNATEVDLPSKAPSLHRPNRVEEQVDHPPRSFMHAQVDVHGTTVNVIAIRFIAGRPASHALTDEIAWGRYLLDAQQDEVRFLLDYISRLKGAVVFGGDLNAPPTAPLIHELDSIASDAYLANHWVGLPTFPTKFPVMRLDYLFSMNGVVATGAERPDLRVSDHYPILARFSVSSKTSIARATS